MQLPYAQVHISFTNQMNLQALGKVEQAETEKREQLHPSNIIYAFILQLP